jgi:adenine-specific DNA-methyltransferase
MYSKNNKPNKKKIKKLFFGENLSILNLIYPQFKSQIKCIYIDPPYNNGELYDHYDDRISENWLVKLKTRIKIMHKFLKDNGSLWISIDDNEMHYLKVAVDEIFGRKNFITTIIWQQRISRENRKTFSNNHEYILVYAKNKKLFDKSANKLKVSNDILKRYKNLDNDPRGNWQSISINVQAGHAVKSKFYKIKSPSGKIFNPPKGRCWAYNKKKFVKLVKEKRIWFGLNGDSAPRYKKFLSESKLGTTPETIWLGNEVGTNDEAKKEILNYGKSKVFETPKPKRLIEKIFKISTNKGDLILDAYAGSGTSAVVANEMNLQFIAIDQGKHFLELTLKRIKKENKLITNEKIEIYKHSGNKILKSLTKC